MLNNLKDLRCTLVNLCILKDLKLIKKYLEKSLDYRYELVWTKEDNRPTRLSVRIHFTDGIFVDVTITEDAEHFNLMEE